ncbi:MAG TPA: hypothetical protein GXZ89_01545 [Fastidiosipila sp.]|nr:hypothetical protein [Fastidiosipila sp.]
MKKTSLSLIILPILLALLFSSVSILPDVFVYADETAVETPQIPDTSHVHFDDYLILPIDALPEGWTFGEWQEDPTEGYRRDVFNEEEVLSGYQFAAGDLEGELVIHKSELIIATDTGERARITRDVERPTINIMVSSPLDEAFGTKELIFNLEGRQIGYSHLNSKGGITELYVREEDGQRFSEYVGVYPGEEGATVRFVYDRNDQFLHSSIRPQGETEDQPFERDENDDPVNILWTSGFDITDHDVTAVFDRRFVPDTTHLDFAPFLDLELTELPPGFTAGEWALLDQETIKRELFNEQGEEAGDQLASAQTIADPVVFRSQYVFDLESGERLTTILWADETAQTIAIGWPDGIFDGTKSLQFDQEGHQTGYVVYGADGYQYGYLADKTDDGFSTGYVQSEGMSPDFQMKILTYHYDEEGTFLGGVRIGPEFEERVEFDEEPPTDVIKDLWLTGQEITDRLVEPLVHLRRSVPLVLPKLP